MIQLDQLKEYIINYLAHLIQTLNSNRNKPESYYFNILTLQVIEMLSIMLEFGLFSEKKKVNLIRFKLYNVIDKEKLRKQA